MANYPLQVESYEDNTNEISAEEGESATTIADIGADIYTKKLAAFSPNCSLPGSMNYKCSYCSKLFLRPSALLIHERVHTGERPFRCNICPFSASQKGNLVTHLLVHAEPPLRGRPFSCNICPFTASLKGTLVTHMRIHTENHPYQCDFCHAKFRSSNNLSRHISSVHNC